jgi:hypothetical protein
MAARTNFLGTPASTDFQELTSPPYAQTLSSQTVWIGYANGRIDVWRNGAFQPITAIEETPFVYLD